MTTPRIDAQYQGPQIRERGMVREHLMPADAGNLCATPTYRDTFDLVIDARFANHKPNSARLAAAIRETKNICHRCPVKDACLTVHGPDLELGVVAGATDQERRDYYGQDIA